MNSRKSGHWRSFERDEDGFDRVGRMKPRERKSSRSANLEEGFECQEDQWIERHPNGFAARVVEVHKRYAFISPEPENGSIKTRDVWLATIARRFLQAKKLQRNFIVVGDRVLCVATTEDNAGVVTDLPQCVIQQLSPRISMIRRLDPSKAGVEHILASNVDQLLVVASFVSPQVKWGLIDRYLILAELQGVRPIIVLNKRDLLPKESKVFKIEVYRSLGYTVCAVQANCENAKNNIDIQELKMSLKGKISMLSGHSGVGKSSLVNLFEPELVQTVEKNENISYKGRHTTSYASFIKLGTGGYLMDTPGIRSFVLEELGHRDLSFGFPEMRPFLGSCKYRECRHIEEPECKIRESVENGSIDSRRYKSYRGIFLGTTGREGRVRDNSAPVE
ncbi:MAG: ribosome small subunit-dependent GTPase A [Proteobacteria bacterium]|nr:ribosome small subunit-dependent GTPase A [Pseudomonadota bacterium]